MARPKLTLFLDVISPFAYMAYYVTKVSSSSLSWHCVVVHVLDLHPNGNDLRDLHSSATSNCSPRWYPGNDTHRIESLFCMVKMSPRKELRSDVRGDCISRDVDEDLRLPDEEGHSLPSSSI